MRRIALFVAVVVAAWATVHARPAAPQDRVDPLSLLDGADRDGWQQPDRIMDELGIADGAHVADLMAGLGWFSARLARRVGPNGVVDALDTDPRMIAAITREATQEDLGNIRPILATPGDIRLAPKLQAVLIVDAFGRLAHPVDALRRVAEALAPNGRLGVVDFTKAGAGGPGPALDKRIDPERVVRDAVQAGLTLRRNETFLRYEYVLLFEKTPPGGGAVNGSN